MKRNINRKDFTKTEEYKTMPFGCKVCSHCKCMGEHFDGNCQYWPERKKWLEEAKKYPIEISEEDLEELKRIVEKSKIL